MINIDTAYEQLAALALSAQGKTAPNPNVAAAIYSEDGTLIADGVHNRLLSPDHAEVVAIKKAGEQARGATIVVSLEPCNHTGTTGPCVDAIINAGISKVIFAVADPNPVAAGGAERLKSAGIEVQFVESKLLRDVQRAWLHRIEKGRPYFIWKIAATLDGRIAAADGTSQWITSDAARGDVQQLRSQSDAILIGTGTALADNPTLRPRIAGAPTPIRIVMGGRDVPKDFNLNDGKSQTIFLKSRSVDELLKALDYLPVNQVLVEAGSTLGSALLAAGAIDEIVLYQAPVILGAGKSWLDDIGIKTIAESKRLALIAQEEIGPDLKFRYRVEKY